MSFHINNKGEAGKCSAQNGNCPFGGAEAHYDSLKDARQAYETAQTLKATRSLRKAEPLSPEIQESLARLQNLVTNPARFYYGFPEDELGRSNIESAIRAERDKLKKLHANGDLLYLSTVLEKGDTEAALRTVAQEVAVSNPEAYGWKAVMGTTRRTANAEDQYWNAVEGSIRQNPDHSDAIKAAAEKHRDSEFFSRAYSSRIEVPEPYEKAFEDTWTSSYQGGERWILNELYETRKQLEGVKSGDVLPKDVKTDATPKGARTKSIAQDVLYEKQAYLQHAVRTHGRSYRPTVEAVLAKMKNEGHEGLLPRPLN